MFRGTFDFLIIGTWNEFAIASVMISDFSFIKEGVGDIRSNISIMVGIKIRDCVSFI